MQRDILDLTSLPPKQEFNKLGEQAFGRNWKYRLAGHLDINLKNVQRWADNRESRVPPTEVLDFLRRQVRLVEDTRLAADIEDRFRLAKESGIHSNVLAAVLMEIAESHRTSTTPKDKANLYVSRRVMKERLASEIRQELRNEVPAPIAP